MNSRWDDSAAREAIDRWAGDHGADFALRLYTAHLLGDPALVLHGGGNVSFKGTSTSILGETREVLYIKSSGSDLARLEPADLPAVELAGLRRLRTLSQLDDAAMVNEIRRHLLDAESATPSIETLLHAFLPHRYVDHSHADAVLAVTNQPDGAERVREIFGARLAVIPYVTPGFPLATAVVEAYEHDPAIIGAVLLHHGLITFADDARTSYERHIECVTLCKRHVAERSAGRTLRVAFSSDRSPAELAALVAPTLRGLLAEETGDPDRPHRAAIMEWRASESILSFVNSAEAESLAASGPLTTDHLIRTRPWPMFVAAPQWADDEATRLEQLRTALAAWRQRYADYVLKHEPAGGRNPAGSRQLQEASRKLTPAAQGAPRVVLLPGAGLFAFGPTKRDALIAADIAEHTLETQRRAELAGRYVALTEEHLHFMEFRAIQRAKLKVGESRPLAGQVVVISGAAGAIGVGIAEAVAEAGAHVALTDVDGARLEKAVARVQSSCHATAAAGFVVDVTDDIGVGRGFDDIVRHFGGVDVVVANAGVAHVAPIAALQADDFRRVMEINALGYLNFMRAGVAVLKRQGLGGHVIINASKNVFAPGRDFGAYSASKAAAHQLGRVAAIELAECGIRVNMINADAVFGDEETPSGLWRQVGPERARSRNLKPDDLEAYYRSRNLLKARVTGRHVGNAVVFFASNATPTTGATLPVDGGISEAFPR